MHGYIEPFYRAVESTEQKREGGHVWLDQPIYMPPRHGLAISRTDPTNDRNLKLRIGGRTDDTFDHPPIKSLSLESTEAAVVAKTKKDRPVIVLPSLGAQEPQKREDRLLLSETCLVVPVYGGDQYDERLRMRVRAYECPNLFYLPAAADPHFDEGWARLDHVQAVSASSLRRHKGLALSDEALDALVEWFVYFATGEIPDDSLILEYRRDRLAELLDAGKGSTPPGR